MISRRRSGGSYRRCCDPIPAAGRNIHDLKDIVDAILYINVNGCKWADLPHDFTPFTSVSHHDRKWSKDGTWRRINDALREAVRERAGRDRHPSVGSIDSQ